MRAPRLFKVLALVSVACPDQARATASAELYRTQAYLYGRFEARIRYAAGDGVISSFFLWKEGSEKANTFWNELDFEKLGADCHMQTNAIYGNPSAQHAQTNPMPGDICAEYHDYRFEWSPDYIAWAVDGQEIRRDTGATATAFSQNAAAGMTFHFNIWPGNQDFGGNFNPAILPVRQYISWVQYSSYDNGAFRFTWREDFDGGSLPSGWAVGTWASPYNLSTHNSANVTFATGVAVLSLTADNATGFSGTPPADNTNTGGVAGTSGSAISVGGRVSSGGTSSASSTRAASGASSVNSGGTSTGDSTANNDRGGVGNTAGGAHTGGSVSLGGMSSVGGRSPTVGGGATTVEAGGMATGGARTLAGGSTTTSGGATDTMGSRTATGGSSESAGGSSSTASQATLGGGTSTRTTTALGFGGAAQESVAANGARNDDGCSCRIRPTASRSWAFAAVGLLACAFMRTRKRSTRIREGERQARRTL